MSGMSDGERNVEQKYCPWRVCRHCGYVKHRSRSDMSSVSICARVDSRSLLTLSFDAGASDSVDITANPVGVTTRSSAGMALWNAFSTMIRAALFLSSWFRMSSLPRNSVWSVVCAVIIQGSSFSARVVSPCTSSIVFGMHFEIICAMSEMVIGMV